MWESSSWQKPKQSWDSTGWMDTTSCQATGLSSQSSTDVLVCGSGSVCEPWPSWEEAQTMGSNSKDGNSVVAVKEETDQEVIPEHFPFLALRIPATLDFAIESDRFAKNRRRIKCDGCPMIVEYHDSMCRYLGQFLHRSMMKGHSYIDLRSYWAASRFDATFLCIKCLGKDKPEMSEADLKKHFNMFDSSKQERAAKARLNR